MTPVTDTTTYARSGFFAVIAAATATVGRAVINVLRALMHRRTVLEMASFDDRMLSDIGLTRGDVHAALSLPVDMDPSARLRILAVERRAGNRALARERLAAQCATAAESAGTPRATRAEIDH